MAPLALNEMILQHHRFGLLGMIDSYPRETVGFDAEKTLILRERPFFRSEIQFVGTESIAGIPVQDAFKQWGPYYSSFDSNFHYLLWRPDAVPILAGGMQGQAKPGSRITFLQAGAWRISTSSDQGLTLNGESFRSGDVYTTEKPSVVEIKSGNSNAVVKFTPEFQDGEIHRSAAFANAGELDRYNRPEGNAYHLSNNVSVVYSMYIPEDTRTLRIDIVADEPTGGGVLLELGEATSMALELPREVEPGEVVELRVPMPEDLRGSKADIRISNASDNSVNKPDSKDVRVLKIESLVLENQSADLLTEDLFAGSNQYPNWAPHGWIPVADPAFRQGVSYIRGEEADLSLIETVEDGTRIPISKVPSNSGIELPAFPVREQQLLGVRVAVRTENLDTSNVAALVSFFREDGSHIGTGFTSQLTIGRYCFEPASRAAIVPVPPGAAGANITFYVNRPKDSPYEDDAAIVVTEYRIMGPAVVAGDRL